MPNEAYLLKQKHHPLRIILGMVFLFSIKLGLRAGTILDAQRNLYTLAAVHFTRHTFTFNTTYSIAGSVIRDFHSYNITFSIFIRRYDLVITAARVVHGCTT
jgi:hypothetical protein